MTRTNLRCFFAVSIACWWLAIGAAALPAAEIRGGESVVVKQDETIEDDLYAFAEKVIIDGTVRGDVIAWGSVIRINGVVEGDLIAAGGAVVIKGTVGDDVRMAGQVLKIAQGAKVGDDVLAAGLSLETEQQSTIGGQLYYGGYQARLAGTVEKEVTGAMSACELAGQFHGDVQLQVDGQGEAPPPNMYGNSLGVGMPNVKPGLKVTDDAKFTAKLTYKSSNVADIADGANFAQPPQWKQQVSAPVQPPTTVQKVLVHVRRFAALLLVGLVVVLAAPRWSSRLADTVRQRPMASFGFGLLAIGGFVVALPLCAVLTVLLAVLCGMVTLGDLVPVVLVLGLLLLLGLVVGFWLFAAYLSEIVVSLAGGRLLLGSVAPSQATARLLPLLVGLIVFVLLSAVPVLGAVVVILFVLLGLGALCLCMFGKRAGGTDPLQGDVKEIVAEGA